MIWLVDATTYNKNIDSKLALHKTDYARIKNHVKYLKYGYHIPPKSKTYAFGLLRIATILNYNGLKTKYIHFNDLELFIRNTDELPHKIAFSVVTPTVDVVADFCKRFKDKHPNIQTIIGGPHINSAIKKTIKRYPIFDIYVDKTDIEAAEAISGIRMKDTTDYYVDFRLLPYDMREYLINTTSTLGCKYECKYCQDRFVQYQEVSDDGFISFFSKVLQPKSCIHFFDSVLGVTKQRAIKVCDAIKKTDHQFILSCDMRAEYIDEGFVKRLSEAGFREVRMGIETIDEELLFRNNRTLIKERLLKAIDTLRSNSNIYITLYSMTGMPGSTIKSYDKTKAFFSYLLECNFVDEIKNCIFVPYPKDIEVYDKDELTVINLDWNNYDRQSFPNFCTPELSAEIIWNQYIDLHKNLNRSWMNGLKIKSMDDLNMEAYSEYILQNYIINGGS